MNEEETPNKEFDGMLAMIIMDLKRIIKECPESKTLNDLKELKETLESIVG